MFKLYNPKVKTLLITGLIFLILSEKATTGLAIVICWIVAGIMIGTGGYLWGCLWYRARQQEKRRQLLLKLYGNQA